MPTYENLYLLIVPRKHYWRGVRIARIAKKRIEPNIGQAIVRLRVELPDGVLQPPECHVVIKHEHLSTPKVEISSQPGG